MIDMSKVWIGKAEALKSQAKKQFMETGKFDAKLAEKAHKMQKAAEECR